MTTLVAESAPAARPAGEAPASTWQRAQFRGMFDPEKLTDTERAGGWDARIAQRAARLADDYEARAAPRHLCELAEAARLVDCDECGARAHRRQCGPHGSYHILRFTGALCSALITPEEFVYVLRAAHKWRRPSERYAPMLVKVNAILTLQALDAASRAAVQAGDATAAGAYAQITWSIREGMPRGNPHQGLGPADEEAS
jgi:hypothetical protein